MKKSLSLILAIALVLASAFFLGGPAEVRSEDPPLSAPTIEPYYVHEDFAGEESHFQTTVHWILRLSTLNEDPNNDPTRVEKTPVPPEGREGLFDEATWNNKTLQRMEDAYYPGTNPSTVNILAVTPSENPRHYALQIQKFRER